MRACIVLLWAAVCLAAQARPVVLRAARLFDSMAGRLVSPELLVVADGKILAVGPEASIPPGAEMVDLSDATLLPGFIDAHTHLSGEYIEDWRQGFLDKLRKTVAEQALDATENLRNTLMAGFTTCRDVGGVGFIDWACATRCATAKSWG